VGDASNAIAAIVSVVARGDLTPEKAGELSALVTNFVKTIETVELEQRIENLETRRKRHGNEFSEKPGSEYA